MNEISGLTVEDVIFANIRDAIGAQKLPPGTRLREDEIRAIFDVSRARIRKVFARLAYEGLVTIEANRGASVAKPSVEEARDLFAARRTIEATIVAEVAQRMGLDAMKKIGDHVALEAEAEAAGNRAEMIRLSGEFHLLLARLAGNSILEKFLRELVTRESLVIQVYERPGRPSCSDREHRGIFEALAKNSAPKAIDLMMQHLRNVESRLDFNSPENREIDLATILIHQPG